MNQKKQLIFSGVFLYMNDEKLLPDIFKEKIPPGQCTNDTDTKVQTFNIVYDDRYLKLSFGDGMLGPRNPKVFNLETHEEEENPRQKHQIEPRQTFAIIDFNTSFLWISNSKKRSALIELLKHYFPTTLITAKDIYDETQFVETLRRLDTIKVSAVPNLLSQTGILSDKLCEEINGYEANVATLSLSYNNRYTSDYLIEKVKSIFGQKNALKSIVISGRDNNNLGMLFNTEGFSRKIEVEAIVDDDEMFDPEDVFLKLRTKIESENI
ncbi:hypothetical protein [Flavobacterium magnum]|nr:hypothetical protein [Flavobacterium magnum]